MMFKGRGFFRKLKKKKVLLLVICIIVISCAYFAFEKIIDLYVFKFNKDIVCEENFEEKSEGEVRDNENWFDWLFGKDDDLESQDDNNGENTNVFPDGNVVEEDRLDYGGNEIEKDVDDQSELIDKSGEEINGESSANQQVDDREKIFVYITGEVNAPGVVVLNEGSRIVDAINAAGGTNVKADISKVNLVYVLEDGMKVNIPNSDDLKNNPNFEYITMSSGDGAKNEADRGNAASESSSSNSNSISQNAVGVVNINKATQTELECLPGIGPSLALRIINYRKENGYFSSVEELKNVSGIGDKKFDELRRYITV